MATVGTRYQTRAMTLEDIPQVVEIEREAFSTAWPSTAYRRELLDNQLARYIVVEEMRPAPPPLSDEEGWMGRMLGRWLPGQRRDAGSLLVGFAGLWLMVDEAHIVSVAVRSSHRRQGVGELLLIKIFEEAAANSRSVVTLECRVSNLTAQALYQKYGFHTVGVRPRYYTDNNEDALIMTTDPINSPSQQALLQRLKEEHQLRWPELYTEG